MGAERGMQQRVEVVGQALVKRCASTMGYHFHADLLVPILRGVCLDIRCGK